ncbi:MAG: fructose-bisphosphatase class III [Verrucomicrobiota bacterium]
MSNTRDAFELAFLEALSVKYPNISSALTERARLSAKLAMPKPTVHVISDVHGEYAKLRHVINNASGSLRPLIEELFADELSEEGMADLVATLYYPVEVIERMHDDLEIPDVRREWVRRTLRRQARIIRHILKNLLFKDVLELIPEEWRGFFMELIQEPAIGRDESYINMMIEQLAQYDKDLNAVRLGSMLVRNLSAQEIIVAGDLGDRGPRLDKVIDYLMRLPKVSLVWGNHDVSWMGACLGHEALIANVLRISLRYRRLFQLEEGYGLLMLPLEQLAEKLYGDDPAEFFYSKDSGMRDPVQVARMQKAITVMQFKLEGQLTRRHPEWDMEDRNVLHHIDYQAGTVHIQGKVYPLKDSHFPTIDPDNPYELCAEEQLCMSRLRQSFLTSARLWEHMSWVERHGSMYTVRDHVLIYHGCMPVDEKGEYLKVKIDDQEHGGKHMFDAFDNIIRRAFRKESWEESREDTDWFWYLWAGPKSPLFGKDRMATFENYFVEAQETHQEIKNPYFKFIHDYDFCVNVAGDFGVDDKALIVNGHVPVKVDQGEEPVKGGGNAVTIDGAFSEAYGDRGYTLVLGPNCITLAELHHFESIEEAIRNDVDIIPKVTTITPYDRLKTWGDTEEGAKILNEIASLAKLIRAYQDGVLMEKTGPRN